MLSIFLSRRRLNTGSLLKYSSSSLVEIEPCEMIDLNFSILAFSSFVPSIYFGLLTRLAMFMALLTALTLLPRLMIVFMPFGEDAVSNNQIGD